jgi:DNA polymerase
VLANAIDLQVPEGVDTETHMKSMLMSQPQFEKLLVSLGVEVPMKPSPSKKDANGNPVMIPALAKTDAGMAELMESDDWRVQVAATTRLGTKSTQLETRLETFIRVAEALGGRLPVPLNYCGAIVTWRMSGAMKMNMQNMTRVDPDSPKPTDAMRYALEAPPGHKVGVVDSSNIEMRVAHTMAGEEETLRLLKEGKDLYAWFAEKIFGYPINKKQHPVERFVGKVAMLSLQYGSSWRTFQAMVRVQSKGKIRLSDDEAKRIVALWRETFPKIAGWDDGIWVACDVALTAMSTGENKVLDSFGLCTTGKDLLRTPGGHWLAYPKLRKEKDSDGRMGWVYGEGRNKRRIYGAQLFENICQHLSRLIVMEQTLELDAIEPVVLSCHDEAVVLPEDSRAEWVMERALEIFSKAPDWWPDLPLAAEGDLGPSYGHAK